MSKRANGEGSIFKQSDGRWRATISITVNGKRVRRSRIAHKRSDALALLDDLRSKSNTKVAIDADGITLAEWLAKWLDEAVRSESADNTHASYSTACKKHLIPRIGGYRLTRITPRIIHDLFASMEKAGVGGRTRQNAYTVLRMGLAYAKELGVIASNPCEPIARPKHRAKEMMPFEQGEAKAILKASKDTRWHAFHHLALTTGMRQGELFGLHWSSVDLKAKMLRVEQQAVEISGRIKLMKPKTTASLRTIQLTQSTVQALKDHRAIIAIEGQAENPLVFPASEGGIISRGNFRTRVWNPLLAGLKLSPRGYHNTRHTYATLALGAGVPPHVVSKILGHSKPSITMDIYAHVLKTHQDAATTAISRLLG